MLNSIERIWDVCCDNYYDEFNRIFVEHDGYDILLQISNCNKEAQSLSDKIG